MRRLEMPVIGVDKDSHISQKTRDMGHPNSLDLSTILERYLLTATGSRTAIAGTVRPTTAAICRTCIISSSN